MSGQEKPRTAWQGGDRGQRNEARIQSTKNKLPLQGALLLRLERGILTAGGHDTGRILEALAVTWCFLAQEVAR